MTAQLHASPSNKRISELYGKVKNETLILQPEFQRKFVWNTAHKISFIETILEGLPFPEIYTAQSGIDLEKLETQEVIVDGQQRLGTIVQYIDGVLDCLSKDHICPFAELGTQEQKDFLNYSVVVRDLGETTPDIIKEIFRRINLTKYALNDVEIHNAVYDGEFITTAKNILKSIPLDHFPVFSHSDFSRMADLHMILLVLATLENGGYFARDADIERFIIANNDEYPSASQRHDQLLSVFSLIEKLALPDDSIWFRKSNFFTLVVEFASNTPTEIDCTIDNLIKFAGNVLNNRNAEKNKNDYSEYYSYMYTGTNSRKARVTRSELFVKYIIKGVS